MVAITGRRDGLGRRSAGIVRLACTGRQCPLGTDAGDVDTLTTGAIDVSRAALDLRRGLPS